MKNLDIRLGANNPGDNYNVAFKIEVIQNGQIVMEAYSTEGDRTGSSPTLIKSTTNFDNTQVTTVRYYNLGKKTNTISVNLINLAGGTITKTGGTAATDGQKQEAIFTIATGDFAGYLNVICNELSTTLSGVDYVGSGTKVAGLFPSIISTKTGSTSFVGVETANVTLNPNYIAASGLTAPTVSATTIQNTDSLTIAGMTQGDVMHFYLNNVKQDNDSLIVSSTGQFIFPSMTGYEGTVYFNYSRNNVISPNSENVTVSVNPNKLGYLTLTSVNQNQPNYYVGEQIDVTDIAIDAVLKIGKGSTAATTVVGTDYNMVATANGFRVTFLIAQAFQFWQTKTAFVEGNKTMVQVGETRPVLAVPIPSSTAIEVNGKVTITNQTEADYGNINVLKAGVIVIQSEGDYSLSGGIYTFLKSGTYTFVGQKASISDSVASVAVIVSAVVVVTPPISPNVSTNVYTATVKDWCTVAPENIQIGTGVTANVVTNWTDGLTITLDITNNVRPNFWLRDKTNHATVSLLFVKIW